MTEQEDVISIANDDLSIEIAPLGAEMRRLRDAARRDLQWDGDPAIWTGRAPILFPIVGRLAGDTYLYQGRRYTLPKHGFARHSRFTVIAHEATRATFRLEADDATRAAYPFEFRLDLTYALAGNALTVSAAIGNRGDTRMPASFGFHPAFRWPLPGGAERADHRLTFPRDETAPVRRIDRDGLLLPAPEPSPVEGRELAVRDALFVADALIFDRLDSRSVRYGGAAGPQIEMSFQDFPILGVWTKPGAGFLCIEPWQGLPDTLGFADDIFKKSGVLAIAPGATRTLSMTIALVG